MKKILVPVDGSEASKKAAMIAVDLAQKYSSELIFLSVAVDVVNVLATGVEGVLWNYKQITDDLMENANRILRSVLQQLDTHNLTVSQKVVLGIAHEEIVNMAEAEACDLIVMGRRGLSGINRFFVGSVTQRVLAEAPCSVFIVKD